MTIDVDDILSNADFDEWLGGMVEGNVTLRPSSWSDSRPARQYALDELLRIFRQYRPAIEDTNITDVSDLAYAIKVGGAARLYELAMTSAPDPGIFFHLEKRYRGIFTDEVRRIGDAINALRCADPRGRGRRVLSLGRR